MTNHRKLQRALFRMQLDAELAAAVFAEDQTALESLGLGPKEHALLLQTSLAAVSADPGGRRRTQVLANASSEFMLSLLVAGSVDQAFLQEFGHSPELHRAIDQDTALPFAFADYAEGWAEAQDLRALVHLIGLERGLAHTRRAHRQTDQALLPVGTDLRLPPGTRLLRLPRGIFTFAGDLRVALDGGRTLPDAPDIDEEQLEVTVIVPRPGGSIHSLAQVHAETLAAPADELFLRLALSGQAAGRDSGLPPGAGPAFDASARADFAREAGASPEDLEAFIEGLISEGLLVRC
ncbi:MAG: hypothetical protein ACI8QS_000893 [Planctomycetota bacterium]|jgi:hypothetical protein